MNLLFDRLILLCLVTGVVILETQRDAHAQSPLNPSERPIQLVEDLQSHALRQERLGIQATWIAEAPSNSDQPIFTPIDQSMPTAEPQQTESQQTEPQTAEPQTAEPKKQKKRSLSIGVGGSFGLGGENTGLSEGGFSLMTKRDLGDRFSIRGSNVFGSERSANTIALTANFPVATPSGEVKIVPFIGGGILLSSKSFLNDVNVYGLFTGGVDVPISTKFSATSSINVGFSKETTVGLQVGLLYRL